MKNNDFVERKPFRLKRNLHKGIGNWQPNADVMDLAASIQAVTEEVVLRLTKNIENENYFIQ